MFQSPFNNQPPPGSIINPNTEIVFVADLFAEDYVGGAELTTQALIDWTELNVQKVHARDITVKTLESGVHAHWVFTNFSTMNMNLIPNIISNIQYSVVEYDYKFCVYRSVEKHLHETGIECDCHESMHGKMISAFYCNAKSLWWMSEKQQERYLERYPFLDEVNNAVLSSVFDDSFFSTVRELNEKYENHDRSGWIVLGSNSWIKGADTAEQYCKDNNLDYEVVWGLEYNELLEKLATSKGFVYLPKGGDTCPRMVIEAKLLGCELVLNEHVQHADELWFNESTLDTLSYLYAARERFWSTIKSAINYTPTISGYTTVYNAESMGYPWKATVESMLGFCDEVVVVDGGSSDETWNMLEDWAAKETKIKAHQHNLDKNNPSFAYESDGKLKARARSYCSMEYCWQMDADEVVHEDDYEKIKSLLRSFPRMIDIVALPVIEYWGSDKKVRMDINPWKWRLSRNLPHITQGIPGDLLNVDNEGYEYASQGTDSCDYIHLETKERLPHTTFYTQDVHQVRMMGLTGNNAAVQDYEQWFNRAIDLLPGVHHYSWINISNKIRQYKKHWGMFWKSLYRLDYEDTAANNVMFDKPWADVTEEDISTLGNKLANEMGGWIFHEKVDFSKTVPHIEIMRGHPRAYTSNKVNDGNR